MKIIFDYAVLLCVLILFSSFASAYTLNSDNFNYITDFTASGWGYSNGACGGISEFEYPATYLGLSYFGYNMTNNCTFSYTRFIRAETPSLITQGSLLMSADYLSVNNSGVSQAPCGDGCFGYMCLRNGSIASQKQLCMYLHNTSISVNSTYGTGATSCSAQLSDFGIDASYPFSINLIMEIDLDNNLFSGYVITNGSISNTICTDNTLSNSTDINVDAFQFNQVIAGSKYIVSGFDNFILNAENTNVTGLYTIPLNEPCDDDTDCITRNCVLGYCRLKLSGQSCTYNYECLSGQCINSKCSKASLFQAVDDTKDQLFGTDKESSTMIVMIFMAISVAAILIISGMANALKGGFYLSILTLYLEAFFFAFIGWLSFFMVFAFVLVAVIFVIATIFIMNRMPN